MWTQSRAPSRVQRTPSVHSVASVQSAGRPQSAAWSPPKDSSGYDSDRSVSTAHDEERLIKVNSNTIPFPRLSEQKMGNVKEIANNFAKPQFEQPRAPVDDDATSRSSTLDGMEEYAFPEKTAALRPRPTPKDILTEEPRSPAPAPHVPGPLESQLAALMSKLIYMEQKNPAVSVSAEEFQDMQKRLKALEEEKKTWTKRHEAIWALRDEDVENNIKIRGLLAKANRELDATRKLRDEDLENVQIVRSKLAEKTRELERLQASSGRTSPSRGRPGSIAERRATGDLFVIAKAAALEQRALELEKRNQDLVSQVDTLKGGASIDDLNRLTAHQAWKETVSGLEAKLKVKDAELAHARSQGTSTGAPAGANWGKIESILEEHADYRESIGGKLQALRSEKEALLRDLHRKENDCHTLEVKLQSVQRRAGLV